MPSFDHEKLEVYKAAIAFITWLEPILQKVPKASAVRDQLDRASTSIALNIAEGNGEFTGPDRCILTAKGLLTREELLPGKEALRQIVAMLVGLIRANSAYRVHEAAEERAWEED